MVIVRVGNSHHHISQIPVFLCLPKQAYRTDTYTARAPTGQDTVRYRVLALLKRERIETERTTRRHHKTVCRRKHIAVFFRSGNRIDVRHTFIGCRNIRMVKVDRIDIFLVPIQVEVHRISRTNINPVAQLLLHIRVVYRHKVQICTSRRSIRLRTQRVRTCCRTLSSRIGRHPA